MFAVGLREVLPNIGSAGNSDDPAVAELGQQKKMLRVLRRSFLEADTALLAAASATTFNDDDAAEGASAAAVAVMAGFALAAYVGDTRILLCRNGLVRNIPLLFDLCFLARSYV
jgi:serine/threonine protein phosphatase PrpC